MKTLLRIDSSSRIKGSHSRELADYIENTWKSTNVGGKVVYRDLVKNHIPHIHNNTIEGFYMSGNAMDADHKEALRLSDTLINELNEADEILISSPLYNLNIPSNLKAYLDQIVRIGHTFNINADGSYSGMLVGKKVYLALVKGGNYKGTFMEKFDFQEPYLKAILGHIGITEQYIYSLEGTGEKTHLIENFKQLKGHVDNTINVK